MLHPAFSDRLFLDLLSHFQDLCASSMIEVGGGQVGQALVVAVVVVVIDESIDLPLKITG